MAHVVNSASDTFRGQHRFVARPQLVNSLVPRESSAGSTRRAARSAPVRRGAGVRGNPPSRSRSTVHVHAMSWWAGRDKMGNNERRLLLHPPRRQRAARCRRPAGEGAVDQRLEQVIAAVSRPGGHARRPSSWVCQTRPHLLVVAGPRYAHPPPVTTNRGQILCTVGGFGSLFGLGPALDQLVPGRHLGGPTPEVVNAMARSNPTPGHAPHLPMAEAGGLPAHFDEWALAMNEGLR